MFNYQPRVEELELLLLSLNKRNYTMAKNKSQIDIDIIDPILENNLENYELEEDEYAPEKVSLIEALIYNWVRNNLGRSEAMEPSWNISALAEYLHNNLLKDNLSLGNVIYINEDQYDEEDSDEDDE